jgi:hypothetical protein
MPYLGLKGNGLLAGIALSSGMGFVLFGTFYLTTLSSQSVSCFYFSPRIYSRSSLIQDTMTA